MDGEWWRQGWEKLPCGPILPPKIEPLGRRTPHLRQGCKDVAPVGAWVPTAQGPARLPVLSQPFKP